MSFRVLPDSTLRLVLGLLATGMVCIFLLTGIWLLKSTGNFAVLVAVTGLAALGALALAWELVRLHLRRLERLRGSVIVALSDNSTQIVYGEDSPARDEVGRLHAVINSLVKQRLGVRREINHRLEAILGTVAEAVVVVTDSGLVSLVNSGARSLLGADEVAVGTSIFAALNRTDWEKAATATQARRGAIDVEMRTISGEPLKARISALADHGGFSVVFDAAGVSSQVLEHDLDLHDIPPDPQPLEAATPLSDLPCVVLDCETTGLDVAREVILSVGAVRVHGGRIYRSAMIDRIVNPGRPIPKASTAIHGITDDMVAQADGFSQVWPQLKDMLEGKVLIGHNIGFDAAFLAKSASNTGDTWSAVVFLDTLLLYAALEPDAGSNGLDAITAAFGVSIEGRHTALGDALATAEIFTRMLPRLEAAGVTTLGDALLFQQRPKHVIDRQKKAGWPAAPHSLPN